MADPAPVVCPTCGLLLASSADLDPHRRSAHASGSPPPPVGGLSSRVGKIRCSVCEAAFDRPEDWVAHSLSPHRLGRDPPRTRRSTEPARPEG